jgi:hypothetical protein
LALLKSKPVGLVAEREKMPFEVTPFMPYLTRFNTESVKATNSSAIDSKSSDSPTVAPDAANASDPNAPAKP